MKQAVGMIVLGTMWFLAQIGAEAQEYPPGFSFVDVPDPLSGTNPVFESVPMDVPDVGTPFFDAHFGTRLTRVTTISGIEGRHEYARFDPFNRDKSVVILDPDFLWRFYSAASPPYNQGSNLVLAISLAEPRWDPFDPDIVWGVGSGTEAFSIKRVNVRTGTATIVKDFAQDPVMGPIISSGNVYTITMRDEGEPSMDMRYWAFFLQGNELESYHMKYLFTWDQTTDTVLGVYEISSGEIHLDWVGMSALGRYVLIGGDDYNGGNLAGLTMADRALTRFHRLNYGTGHSDVGVDVNGNEVIVMQNSRTDYVDLIPIDWSTQPIMDVGGSYSGTGHVPLVRLYYDSSSPSGLNSGIHVSGNVPGYCVISSYIENLGDPEQNWLDQVNILVRLDPAQPHAFYLSKLQTAFQSYWEEPHTSISRDGSRLVWASNWGNNPGQERVFLMQLDMPANWRDLTGGCIQSVVETLEAVILEPNTATLIGWGSSFGCEGHGYFEWGTTLEYGNGTPLQALSNATAPAYFSASVAGLDPAITYHYRAVIMTGNETIHGMDKAFNLMGGPAVVTVSPESTDFGDVLLGQMASQTFTLSNTGGEAAVLGTLSLSPAGATNYSIANDKCSGQTLEAGANATVDVVFTPVSAGFFGVTLEIPVTSPASSDLSVPLSGWGLSSMDHAYYLPYFITDRDSWSGVAVRNCSTIANASVIVTGYDPQGNSVLTESKTLSPRGQDAFVVGDDLTQEGWLLVESSQPLVGLDFFGTRGLNNHMADITLIPELSTSLIVPHIAQNDTWDTTLMICNPNAAPITVTLVFVDRPGNVVLTHSQEIPAMGSIALEAGALLGASVPFGGSVELSANRGIAAFALYRNLKWGGKSYAGISAVVSPTP